MARGDKGDIDGAIADYNKAVEINPQYAEAYFNRSHARGSKGDLDGAIADLTKAIEINPRFIQAYFNRGMARADKGDLDGAITDFTKAIEINPRYAETYLYLGMARANKGDIDGAIADYNKAIEINPRLAEAHSNLAWLLATCPQQKYRKGQLAIEHARLACDLTNWQSPNCLEVLAASYAETGNFDEAIKWQKKALEFPDFVKQSGDKARQRLQLYSAGKPYRTN